MEFESVAAIAIYGCVQQQGHFTPGHYSSGLCPWWCYSQIGGFFVLFLFCLSLVLDHFQNIVPKLFCQCKELCKNTSNIVLSA